VFRSYLVATLRNLQRNRVYAAITVAGLAIGFAAAAFIALYVRDELSYERWIPGYENVVRITAVADGRPLGTAVPSDVGLWLRQDMPHVGTVARLFQSPTTVGVGDAEYTEVVQWTDVNVFDVLPLPVFAGNLKEALKAPDSVVITRATARKYFGSDNAIGETLTFERKHVMRVTAVLEDLPSNTHLRITMLAPSHAAYSVAAEQDAKPLREFGSKMWNTATYWRLQPGASLTALRAAMPALLDRHARPVPGRASVSADIELVLAPISDVHLSTGVLERPGSGRSANVMLLQAMALVGVLIVAIACINFINLMTARAARRAVEVGVRKALGAGRSHLIAQFVGEALVFVTFAMVLAVALVELTLPQFNAFLGRTIQIDYLQRAAVPAVIALFTLLVGLLAGLYPAFVLSAFRPASVLKGGRVSGGSSAAVRQVLVVVQFSVLIALIVVSIVFYRQSDYAMRSTMREGGAQVIVLTSACSPALKQELLRVAGVQRLGCSWQVPQFGLGAGTAIRGARGGIAVQFTSVDAGLFEVFGLSPVAGRFFDASKSSDLSTASWETARREAIVINETAVRGLGFDSAQAAVGRVIRWGHHTSGDVTPSHDAEIIGVVPDFVTSIHEPVKAMAVVYDPAMFYSMSVRLHPDDLPGTLTRMGRVWRKVGDPWPFTPRFFDQQVQFQYRAITRQTALASALAGVALLIACLGLFGLATFTAERRTKEIGVRKAMGASTADVMRLLVVEFARPVSFAILIAWPLGYFVTSRWLQGFYYRVDLSAWIFVAAAAAALVVSLVTVSTHSFLVARAAPSKALRSE
jgi:putative ABC transport system permease protein